MLTRTYGTNWQKVRVGVGFQPAGSDSLISVIRRQLTQVLPEFSPLLTADWWCVWELVVSFGGIKGRLPVHPGRTSFAGGSKSLF